TGFLYNVWLPRVSREVVPIGEPSTYRNNLSFVKGGMAMMEYFGAFGTQNALMRSESGTVSAIAGIFKAPFDIIADKLRGYIGLTMDMHEQPDKVLKACEALMPHLLHVALTTADPDKKVPIGFWMHRGCVPFITPDQFASHYWPTLKPLIEEMWAHGNQVLFYAEGDWGYHLDQFKELAEGSIVYHVDKGDIFETHKKLGDRFCLSGGIPNVLLSYGTPQEVRESCKKVIDEVAQDGGYIMDASAIMQNDTSIENMKVLTDFTREYGVYSSGSSSSGSQATKGEGESGKASGAGGNGMAGYPEPRIKPGICRPWEEKVVEIPEIRGDEAIVRQQWENTEALANVYIWQCLLSF
ncbi:MAG: uroporphyrinogen decarboxylase family protein, partial [Verrucomicrobiales bacterium]